MPFRRSTLFLIRQRHLRIDIFGINFANLIGNDVVDPNDVSAVIRAGEDGDDEKGDLNTAKDAKKTLHIDPISTNLAKDFSSIKINAPPPMKLMYTIPFCK